MRIYLGEKARHIFTFSKRKTTQLNNKHKLCGDMIHGLDTTQGFYRYYS